MSGKRIHERRSVRQMLRKTTNKLRAIGHDFGAELDAIAEMLEADLGTIDLVALQRQADTTEEAVRNIIDALAIVARVDLELESDS